MLQIYVMRKSGDLGAACAQIADLGCALLVRLFNGSKVSSPRVVSGVSGVSPGVSRPASNRPP